MIKAITRDTEVIFIVSLTPCEGYDRMITQSHVFLLINMLRLVE